MSKESYQAGFEKVAAARGYDAVELANYALHLRNEKVAQENIKTQISTAIAKLRNAGSKAVGTAKAKGQAVATQAKGNLDAILQKVVANAMAAKSKAKAVVKQNPKASIGAAGGAGALAGLLAGYAGGKAVQKKKAPAAA